MAYCRAGMAYCRAGMAYCRAGMAYCRAGMALALQARHIAGQAWHIAGQGRHGILQGRHGIGIAGIRHAWHIAGQAWHIAGHAWQGKHGILAGMAYFWVSPQVPPKILIPGGERAQMTPPRIEPADLPRMAYDASAFPLSHGRVVVWAGRGRLFCRRFGEGRRLNPAGVIWALSPPGIEIQAPKTAQTHPNPPKPSHCYSCCSCRCDRCDSCCCYYYYTAATNYFTPSHPCCDT